MTRIKDVFIVNEGLNKKIREKILPVAKLIKLELEYIGKQEPQMEEMTKRMLASIDDIILEVQLQGNKDKMRTEYRKLLDDASVVRKAAGFLLLTKPGGKPLPTMKVGPGETGDRIRKSHQFVASG